MVKKADNKELDQFINEEELLDSKPARTNNSNNNRNNQNRKKNNNNRNKNRNQRNNNHNHNSNKNNNNSSTPGHVKSVDNQKTNIKKKQQITLDNAPSLDDFENFQKESQNYDKEINRYTEEVNSIDTKTKEELLKSIPLDLNKIEIVSDINYDINKENTNFVLNSKATFQAVLSQSAYIVHLEALMNQDILSIAQSIDDNYNSTLRKYQLYFSKVNTSSLGIKTFEDFAKLTSVYDISTIEYAIYNISFPGETSFDIKCGHCKESLPNTKVSNDQLISIKDDEIYERINKNIKNITTIEENKKYSLIHKTDRVILNDSKIIFDIGTPTLEDHLNILASIDLDTLPEEEKKRFETNSTTLLHIKDIMVPDMASLAKGETRFIKLDNTDLKEFINVIDKLSVRDGHQLTNEIYNVLGKNAIEFAIEGGPCPKCGKDLGKIELDMHELLFREALQLD